LKPTISLCIIAKNEADLIGQCIKSALPYVNQVVLVDTGSTDRTKEIAESLGAEVWDFPWINDFSAARNFSLDKAWGDWILFMDCDEEIEPNTGKSLITAVQSEDFDAYYIRIINVLGGENRVKFHSIRLFRNLSQFRFIGKIHEQISYSIVKHSGREKIGQIDFTLLHHGYNPEKVNIKAKINRNIQLLKEQEDNSQGQDGFLLYNLGIENIRKGQFQEALEKFIAALKVTSSTAGYAPPLVNKTIVCLIEMKRYKDALDQLAYFKNIYPDYSDLYLLEAACHIRCGRFSLAKESIELSQRISQINLNYPAEGTIFGQKPFQLLESFKEFICLKNKKFKLSVCILANNEEKNIAKCIASIGELADEIMLFTTGASDNTLSIAYQMGAHIYRLNWDNSFAKIRNFALKQVSGDWIMFLNGDQELNQADIPKIVEYLNNASTLGHMVKVKTFFDKNNWALYQEEAVCKIFRNNKKLYYQSCLLEDIEKSILEQHNNNDLSWIPVTIFDYGPILKPHLKTPDFKRNVSLIVQDFKNIGKNSSVYEAMGYEFMKVDKFKVALAHLDKALKISNYQAPASLWYKAITCLVKLSRFTKALQLADQARYNYFHFTNIIYLQGYCNLKLDLLEEAKDYFTQCLELGDASWEKYIVLPGAGSYLAQCGLAEIYLKQKKYDKCLEQYFAAAHHPEGKSFAIPPLTKLIIKLFGAGSVLHYLQNNNLDSYDNLCIAADTINKIGCDIESIELLDEIIKKIEETNDPSVYVRVSSLMFDFLGNLYNKAITQNPDDSLLIHLKNFFIKK
jgi:glycosyltransferase involved in cell wall biosynthesis